MRLKRQVRRCERELAAHRNAASAQTAKLKAAIGAGIRSADALATSFSAGLILGLLRASKTPVKATTSELPAYAKTLLKLIIPSLVAEFMNSRKTRADHPEGSQPATE